MIILLLINRWGESGWITWKEERKKDEAEGDAPKVGWGGESQRQTEQSLFYGAGWGPGGRAGSPV